MITLFLSFDFASRVKHTVAGRNYLCFLQFTNLIFSISAFNGAQHLIAYMLVRDCLCFGNSMVKNSVPAPKLSVGREVAKIFTRLEKTFGTGFPHIAFLFHYSNGGKKKINLEALGTL